MQSRPWEMEWLKLLVRLWNTREKLLGRLLELLRGKMPRTRSIKPQRSLAMSLKLASRLPMELVPSVLTPPSVPLVRFLKEEVSDRWLGITSMV